jgi:hypothetical protein
MEITIYPYGWNTQFSAGSLPVQYSKGKHLRNGRMGVELILGTSGPVQEAGIQIFGVGVSWPQVYETYFKRLIRKSLE